MCIHCKQLYCFSDSLLLLLKLLHCSYSLAPHIQDVVMSSTEGGFGVQADAFARKLGYAVPLRAGLIKLQVCCNCICNFSQLLQQFTIFALVDHGQYSEHSCCPITS
jgi:hypothetical protein